MKFNIDEYNSTFSDEDSYYIDNGESRLGFITTSQETINENYNVSLANRIAIEVSQKINLGEPKLMGKGSNGVAFDIGDNKVLKITGDRSEAVENKKLLNKNLKRIAKPYKVYVITSKKVKIPETYAIILEKLRTDISYFVDIYIRFNFQLGLLKIKFNDWFDHYIEKMDVLDDYDVEKLNAYFKKYPKDFQFINTLLEINDELKSYGIESIDFLNPKNLGFFENGEIGFFDLGYGDNDTTITDFNSIDVSLKEDGSAKFSTQNSIGDVNDSYVDERVLSGIQGSSVVTIKDKCKLGGGKTCNQGDINNLNIKQLHEEIDAEDSNSCEKTYNALASGKKNIGILSINNIPINKIKSSGLKGFKLEQKYDPTGKDNMFIIYRPSYINDALKLYRIMMKHGGYANDITPEEAYEIGKLLDYTDESISKYIEKKYGVNSNNINNDFVSLKNNENDMNINENDILTLDELPFKDVIYKMGGKIYSVGGAVRDEYLGKESKDLDILITGIPMNELENILSKYGRVDAVGKSFGILKFKPEGSEEDIDVAIPRTEKPTGSGGHKGFDVSSDHTLPIEDDLYRRDFTINAIAKDINGNIVDPFGGVDDLKNKVIRIVNPDAFADDPLRMLRAVQFASRFDFKIEPKTFNMIKNNAKKINQIPPERILTEFDKIVNKGDAFVGAMLLKQTGLLKNIFGNDGGILVNDKIWSNISTIGEFIWALSHNIVDDPAEFYKNKLKGTIDTYKEIKALMFAFNTEIKDNVHARSIIHNMYMILPQSIKSNILPSELKNAANELLSGKYPKSINDLAINGNDLINLGMKGVEIGKTFKNILINIYADKLRNDKNELLNYVNNVTT